MLLIPTEQIITQMFAIVKSFLIYCENLFENRLHKIDSVDNAENNRFFVDYFFFSTIESDKFF